MGRSKQTFSATVSELITGIAMLVSEIRRLDQPEVTRD